MSIETSTPAVRLTPYESMHIDQLFATLARESIRRAGADTDVIDLDRHRRVAVFDPSYLRTASAVDFVAFFGVRNDDAPPAITDAVFRTDQQLMLELKEMSGMAAYLSQNVSDSDWVNIVVIKDASAFRQLGRSKTHDYAARTLSPHYYSSVRLHFARRSAPFATGKTELKQTNTYKFNRSKEVEPCQM